MILLQAMLPHELKKSLLNCFFPLVLFMPANMQLISQ